MHKITSNGTKSWAVRERSDFVSSAHRSRVKAQTITLTFRGIEVSSRWSSDELALILKILASFEVKL
jgi:hypothetical protein